MRCHVLPSAAYQVTGISLILMTVTLLHSVRSFFPGVSIVNLLLALLW